MSKQESKLQMITDFFIWLLFNTSILLTVALIIAGTYQLITNPQWSALMLFVAALITLGVHYAIRLMPSGGER